MFVVPEYDISEPATRTFLQSHFKIYKDPAKAIRKIAMVVSQDDGDEILSDNPKPTLDTLAFYLGQLQKHQPGLRELCIHLNVSHADQIRYQPPAFKLAKAIDPVFRDFHNLGLYLNIDDSTNPFSNRYAAGVEGHLVNFLRVKAATRRTGISVEHWKIERNYPMTDTSVEEAVDVSLAFVQHWLEHAPLC